VLNNQTNFLIGADTIL